MKGRAWRLAAVLCAAVLALDQAAKAAVEAALVPGERVEVLGPIELTLVRNEGIAFGLASDGGAVLIAVTAITLLFLLALFAREPARPGMWVAAGLLSGGALGNLADRVREGAVTDYVDVLAWPAFNLADAAIVAGVLVLAASYLREPSG